ncbi:hypothetical protein L596_023021 [Steinernema carpocapsae]|uniref:Uncharacterized protein n=1 Tax=Steinernema carpocapsae TaxID=34508 RepID=A0A4U5MCC9_STECR|nr:hypothetical protein L596_023021 [Steinernema carpocapsae]
MPLGEWLCAFHEIQHAEETRIRDIMQNRAEPRARHPSAIENDRKLSDAREALEFCLEINGNDSEAYWERIMKYLTRAGAILGYNLSAFPNLSEDNSSV